MWQNTYFSPGKILRNERLDPGTESHSLRPSVVAPGGRCLLSSQLSSHDSIPRSEGTVVVVAQYKVTAEWEQLSQYGRIVMRVMSRASHAPH